MPYNRQVKIVVWALLLTIAWLSLLPFSGVFPLLIAPLSFFLLIFTLPWEANRPAKEFILSFGIYILLSLERFGFSGRYASSFEQFRHWPMIVALWLLCLWIGYRAWQRWALRKTRAEAVS